MEQVKHGEWIEEPIDDIVEGTDMIRNRCGSCWEYWYITSKGGTKPNYCPNCGAKMDGGMK